MEDVIVVGAGPGGSSTAHALGKRGYRVTVLEEHLQVGDPENCAGLIGAEVFASYDLPQETVVRDFSSASFFSPDGGRAEVSFSRPMARVVRRGDFDRAMARRAESVGVKYLTGMRCMSLTLRPDCVELAVQPSKGSAGNGLLLATRAVVLATGIRGRLLGMAGLLAPPVHIEAAHTVVRMRDVSEIEVFLGRQWAPGYFAWALPLEEDRVRIGVCVEQQAVKYLKRFFSHPMMSSRLLENGQAVLAKIIPVAPARKSYAKRLLLVGDAAGQVKPTTGGGIGCSVVCGNIAGEVLSQALAEDDLSETFLQRYEQAWSRELASDFHAGRVFRGIFAALPNRSLNGLVRLIGRADIRGLIEAYGDFDRHSGLLRRLYRVRQIASLLGV